MMNRSAVCLTLALLWTAGGPLAGRDIADVSLWDGETLDGGTSRVLNRFGGNPISGSHGAYVVGDTLTVHSGNGALRVVFPATVPAGDFDFVATAFTGFGPSTAYIDTRNLTRYDALSFWIKNETGARLTLKLEIKDYTDSNDNRLWQRHTLDGGAAWRKIETAFTEPAWNRDGNPDLTRARLLAFVFETDQGDPISSGSIYIDDVQLLEKGGSADSTTAAIGTLVQRVTRRHFDALWDCRDRATGLVPAVSPYADLMAVNTTAALVKLLPGAVDRAWLSRSAGDGFVAQIVTTVNTLLDQGVYIPSRYVDRVTLAPKSPYEESPVDASFLYLALYQYARLPETPNGLRSLIEALLDRFNLAAFESPNDCWSLAYEYGTSSFTEGCYDGYSGEIWSISLGAHLSQTHHVPIERLFHSGQRRVLSYLVDPARSHLVHESTEFRAPFLQWLFDLFVDTSSRGRDTYPVSDLSRNPRANAVLYQKEVVARAALLGRAEFLQPDAGDDGSCAYYQQFSYYNGFGRPDVFMPWSVAFVFLADPTAAEAALRRILTENLVGPLGLADVVTWPTGSPHPTQVSARHDFWNVALSTMAFTEYLYHDSAYLTSLQPVQQALDVVIPTARLSISDTRVAENTGPAVFAVALSQPSDREITVGYQTVSGTATAPSDFLSTSGSLTFGTGATMTTIAPSVVDDALDEPNEWFHVSLSSPVNAEISDEQGVAVIVDDDGLEQSVNELAHGTSWRRDLSAEPGAVAGTAWYGLAQKPNASYEVVVDGLAGDLSPLSLERIGPDGASVLQTAVAMGAGAPRSLRWENATGSSVTGEWIRIRSGGCTTDCGTDDQYGVRSYETTYAIARFNNAGTQITVLILQNPADYAIAGHVYFWNPSGALLAMHAFSLAGKRTLVLNTSSVSGASGVSGTMTMSHNGGYGDLAGKTVALEPATGLSFDSPMVPRAR